MRLRKNTIAMAAAACTLLITNATQGAVVVTFAQVGSSVTATWAGTIDTTGMSWDRDFISTERVTSWGVDKLFGAASTGQIEVFRGGTAATLPLDDEAGYEDVFTDTVGGFFGGQVSVVGTDNNTAPVSNVHPMTGVITWTGTTLAGFGASAFDNTLAFTAASGDTIRFTTIPEPGCALLASVGMLCLGRRVRLNRERSITGH